MRRTLHRRSRCPYILIPSLELFSLIQVTSSYHRQNTDDSLTHKEWKPWPHPARTQTEARVSGLLLWMISTLPLFPLSVSITLRKKYGHILLTVSTAVFQVLAGCLVTPQTCSLRWHSCGVPGGAWVGSFANKFNGSWMLLNFYQLAFCTQRHYLTGG